MGNLIGTFSKVPAQAHCRACTLWAVRLRGRMPRRAGRHSTHLKLATFSVRTMQAIQKAGTAHSNEPQRAILPACGRTRLANRPRDCGVKFRCSARQSYDGASLRRSHRDSKRDTKSALSGRLDDYIPHSRWLASRTRVLDARSKYLGLTSFFRNRERSGAS